MNEDMKSKIRKNIELFGPMLQQVVVIEELSELQKEITKELRFHGVKEHMIDEIADVSVGLETLKAIHHITDEEIEERIAFKLNRLDERIEKGTV